MQPRALRLLLAINVVAYLVWQVFLIHFPVTYDFVIRHIALNPGLPGIVYEPWQLLTYSFLHLGTGLGGLLHIGFNMLWMFWIGKEYEETYGPGRILGIYILGAAGGALMTVGLHALFPGASFFGGIVHGASGAVMALMTMVAIHQPDKRIGLMFIGVVRLIHVVIGFMALDILFLSAGGTSVSAHLGGIATGFLFGRILQAGGDPFGWSESLFSVGSVFARGQRGSRQPKYDSYSRPRSSDSGGVSGGVSSGVSSGGILDKMEARLARRSSKKASLSPERTSRPERKQERASGIGETNESAVDRILDKISATGYDSLSDEEKRFLVESGSDND